ncbi:MAG TPA: signal recognition particle receptor subunit alpha, partial [Lentisphaeria bacterium]|nr:signal recognition particle receptor subunit alpha [Lentisphaeria bacterium]
MFNQLTSRFQQAFRNLTGRGRLTESNISDAMAEIRRALLEADVNYEVAKSFIDSVRKQSLGVGVMKSVTPGQQVVKIVNDKLIELLGQNTAPLNVGGKPPALIMLCGLHGSGKTTTCAKLALHIKDKLHLKVMLAACDVYRPAAIDQLEILGRELNVPVFSDRELKDVARLAVNARAAAQQADMDVLILDTAGRLQIDEELVQELVEIKRRAQPREILLVGDSALGQEAVSVAEHFDRALGITGIILTKLDGDARGGAALSMHQVTGKPIKFVTVGERPIDLEVFHPDRMAQRILGMGDVVSLFEKAAEQFEEEEARKLEERLRKNTFGFDDFLSQISKLRKMGGLAS